MYIVRYFKLKHKICYEKYQTKQKMYSDSKNVNAQQLKARK